VTLRKGLVEFGDADLRVPLTVGERVPCPKCDSHHEVKRDPRPGRKYDATTGIMTSVDNEALYLECPEAPGPILIGIDGRALPEPLELTPRRQTS
jgi:hypothetical protein